MKVSVIIVNYNTKEITNNCIESIIKNTHDIDYEIILIDNCSTDGSVDFFKYDNRINFIISEKNIGFGKANNLGYKHSKGDFILLLNSDTIILNNVIRIFYDKMQSLNSNIGCLGAKLLNIEGSENRSYGKLPTFSRIITPLLFFYLTLGFKKKKRNYIKNNYLEFEVEYIIGADIFLSKKTIDKYGLFDPDFFMYFEDAELQYRYSKHGLKMMIIDGPKIIHLEGQSSKSNETMFSYQHEKLYHTGMFIYIKKRYKRFTYIIFRMLFVLKAPFFLRKHYKLSEKLNLITLLLK